MSSDMIKIKGRIVWPVLVALYVSAFFVPYLFSGKTTLAPSYQDESQWLIYREFINQSFSSGHFPLWTPDLYCGMPFLAWAHSASIYPLNIVHGLLDFATGVWALQWIHALIYSIGLFYLARRLGASKRASFLAVTVATALFISGALGNFMPTARTGSWAPWLFFFIHGLLLEKRLKYLAGFVFINLIMFLGGHIELTGLGYEVVAVVLLASMVAMRKRWREVLSAWLLFGFAFFLAYMTAQVQALPSTELNHYSIRGVGLSYGYFTIFVDRIPNPAMWGPYLACGAVLAPLLASLAGVRRSLVILLLVVALIYCLAVIHNLFWIMRVLYQMPVLNGLIGHFRIAFHAQIVIACLVALGADRAVNSKRWTTLAGAFSIISGVLMAAVWYLVDPSLASVQAEPGMKPVIESMFSLLWIPALIQFSLGFYLAGSISLSSALSRKGRLNIFIIMALSTYSVPLLFSMPQNEKDPFSFPEEYVSLMQSQEGLHRTQTVYDWEKWEKIGIPLQTGIIHGTRSADGFITVSVDRYTRFLNAIMPGAFREKDGKIADLEATKIIKEGAFISSGNVPWLNFMGIKYIATERRNIKFADHFFLSYPDTPLSSAITDIDTGPFGEEFVFIGKASGKVHIQPGDTLYSSFRSNGGPHQPAWFSVYTREEDGDSSLKYCRLDKGGTPSLNIDFAEEDSSVSDLVFSAYNREGPFRASLKNPVIKNSGKYFNRLPVGESFNIFKNPGALPPVFFPVEVTPASREDILSAISSFKYDPSTHAFVEDASFNSRIVLPLARGEAARVQEFSREHVTILSRSRAPRLMVFTDAYFPGWRAAIEGKKTRINPTNYAFRGVFVPEGTSEIKMSYEPASFRLGLWITITCLVSLMLAWLYKRSAGGKEIER